LITESDRVFPAGRLAGSDLVVLATGFGRVVPVEPSAAEFDGEAGGASRSVQGDAGWCLAHSASKPPVMTFIPDGGVKSKRVGLASVVRLVSSVRWTKCPW